jgi:hypothetical protein
MKPASFLKVILHTPDPIPSLTGMCASFENEEWRFEAFARHLFEWLPEFALNHTESESLNKVNAVDKLRQAAKNVYSSDKFKNRGEFGELLLHAVIREIYNTVPAISKVFYKDGPNDTVKGFDAVHVVTNGASLELWLGEVKFYNNINSAIRDVIDELKKHTNLGYLRTEFMAITNKVDNSWPHADRLKKLLSANTSMDEVFDVTCIPVLLTYDSDVVKSHTKHSAEYVAEICEELNKFHKKFCDDLGKFPLTIHLFLIPLKDKAKLVSLLDNQLKIWQKI